MALEQMLEMAKGGEVAFIAATLFNGQGETKASFGGMSPTFEDAMSGLQATALTMAKVYMGQLPSRPDATKMN